MLSRRQFLRFSVVYAAGVLAACAPQATPTQVPPTSAPSIVPPSSPISIPTSTTVARATATFASPTTVARATMTATPVPPTAGEPYLVVARGATPGTIVRAAVDALGGISKFVKPGNDVILKPNICNAQNTFEYASTTNPEVMAELVKLCLEAGAKRVRVMDQPFSGTANIAYQRSGIKDAIEKVGGVMEIMANAKYVATDFPNGRDLKSSKVYQDILKTDVLINVPIAKQHGSAQVTLAMKAMMGVIQDRNEIHWALDQRIADLNTLLKPTLHIVDAIRVLTRNGPTGGSLNDVMQANTIIASVDPVATDAYTTQLFFKKKPEQIGYIKYGAAMGLGRYDFANLRIKEVTA